MYGNAAAQHLGVLEQRRAASRSSVGVFTFNSTDGQGTTFHDVSPDVSLAPVVVPERQRRLRFSRNHDESQWVENDRRRALRLRPARSEDCRPHDAGELHGHAEPVDPALRRAVRVGGRLLELQGAGQRPREALRATATAPIAYTGNPDFNYRSFRTTNVLRWEYKPGSTLFVVWQQGREDSVDTATFNFGRDFGGVFDAPARNVFLVKWAYWLNY